MTIIRITLCLFLFVCLGALTGCGSSAETGSTIPTGVMAQSGLPGTGEIIISWTAVEGATSYNIYWSATPGVTTVDNKITGASSPAALTVTNLRHDLTPYYFVVTAVFSGVESGTSTEVSAKHF
jgi:hypothetical protein